MNRKNSKGVIALALFGAMAVSGCATWGENDTSQLVSVDNSWSIRSASAKEGENSVRLVVQLRRPLSRRSSRSRSRHLWIEVKRNSADDIEGMAIDLNLMQRASITELPQDKGAITGIHVEFHNDHNVREHT
jgi:hypothetical protein